MNTTARKHGHKNSCMRRTQAERRATTQQIILEATLKSLAARGYSRTTLSAIAKEAGVSKGALNHHYSSKLEIVASAMEYFYGQADYKGKESAEPPEDHTFRERMHSKFKWSSETLPLRLEFLTAMRTDETLREAYMQKIKARTDNPVDLHPSLSEFSKDAKPGSTATLHSAVLLGLGLLSSVESPERIYKFYDHFIDVLEVYLRSSTTTST